jgi:hypothetical protein
MADTLTLHSSNAVKLKSDYRRIKKTTNEIRRMASSEMLRSVVLIRPDVSEEFSTFNIGVTRLGELETTLALN